MKLFSKIFERTRKETNKQQEFRKSFYSQDGEDALVMSFYEDKPEYRGFYVDIGAMHPLRYSNTQIFYEKGWRGVNIDATPGSMIEFRKLRPNDINIELGVSEKRNKLNYYSFEEPALNSFNKEISENRIRDGWKLKEIVHINSYPINDILEKYMPQNQLIDFINMDIEGLESPVLSSLNFKKFSPNFFLIEELDFVEKDFTQNNRSPVYALLKNKGYAPVAKTMRTVIYKKL